MIETIGRYGKVVATLLEYSSQPGIFGSKIPGQPLGVEGILHSFVQVPASILDEEKVALCLPIHPCRDQRGGLLELGA